MTDTAIQESPLPAPKVLLMGNTGTGKTYSIRTLIDAGITPFCIFTEPGQEVLGDIPKDKLHWHYIKPMADNWNDMKAMAKMVNTSNFDSISKYTDPKRMLHTQFMQVLECLENFKCDRTGEEFGDVTRWNTDRALVIDSLSGINAMVKALVIGAKPVMQMQDWQVAQNTLSRFLDTLTVSARCWFILLAHEEREQDELTGGTKVMVSTLGKKLAPILPRYFSDVIESQRLQDKFTWSTASALADVKARNLPIAANIQPSFVQINEKWKSRGGLICPTEKPEVKATA